MQGKLPSVVFRDVPVTYHFMFQVAIHEAIHPTDPNVQANPHVTVLQATLQNRHLDVSLSSDMTLRDSSWLVSQSSLGLLNKVRDMRI